MEYRVIWQLSAIEDVEQIYDRALDKEGVIQAAREADRELKVSPNEAGESREPGTRIHFIYPLVVWFHVNERLKEVIVFQVRSARSSK